MNGWEELCLAAIGQDENLVKQIDHALKEVAKNIADPNTDMDKVRKVKVEIKFKPSDRSNAVIEYKVETALAGDAPGADFVTIGRDGTASIPMADQLPLSGIGIVHDEQGRQVVADREGE